MIIEGWMAGVMADELPGVLKVLLTCDEKVRIGRFSEREKIDTAIARRKIQEREQALFAKLSKIHGVQDIMDEKYYTRAIDTSHMKTPEVVERVLEMVTP